ncbi:MAG: tRNA uridine-5-carboxymethylaminomethyl(34) synthesis GTPase MnmE [Acidaminococcus sp.]|jgi:tRNA modification GTPase|nr:tRNA uridine-5-carboxymethylaminomethyl(34) synthesis GTPase MnmE [Acidaminococcus sp.]MCI2115390.1 tRNA uridine-5-carboxymethylaminomethyl(34) synthesis GTPase MnmE [Acidaminococcus sp.]MCI2117486.1 tRNA uridine-5-carboxymethylaminomethyl(34) synthesis GTPase MnmE [Acidaminococcus sp.]
MDDTISAIATALGVGAIGVIRISGSDALKIANEIFRGTHPLSPDRARYMTYGHIVDDNGEIIDEVLAVYMPGPHSYTGEDVVEIQCHGGREALQEILRMTFAHGARSAEPGEFTKRAFLNGRVDLTEAEAVMDIITAKSKRALMAANRGHRGALSRKISRIRADLRQLVVHLEAVIDYPEDDIEEVTYDHAVKVLRQGCDDLEALVKEGATGRILREGLRIAIVGRPNVGKSSLLNRLLQADRAIVSSIPGTTRDVIEEQMTLDGIPLVLTDTAGLRDTDDYVEQIGVKRSKSILEDAQLALVLVDGSRELTDEDRALMDSVKDRPHLILINKTDLPTKVDTKLLQQTYGEDCCFPVSVKNGDGMEQANAFLKRFVCGEGSDENLGTMTQNARQQTLLHSAFDHLKASLSDAENHLPYDCLTIDLTEILHELGEITGEDVPDEIINEIFAQFCVGK